MSVFTYLVVLCRCLKQDKKIRHIFHLISQPINLYSIRFITRSFFLCKIKMLESVPKKIILSSAANIAPFIFGIYFINIFKYSAATMKCKIIRFAQDQWMNITPPIKCCFSNYLWWEENKIWYLFKWFIEAITDNSVALTKVSFFWDQNQDMSSSSF